MPLLSSMLKSKKIHFGFTQGGDSIVFQLSFWIATEESPSSFPGFSLLLRERKIELKVRTLVVAGHAAPKIWKLKVGEGKKSK